MAMHNVFFKVAWCRLPGSRGDLVWFTATLPAPEIVQDTQHRGLINMLKEYMNIIKALRENNNPEPFTWDHYLKLKEMNKFSYIQR